VSIGAFGFGFSQVYFLFAVVLPTIRGGAKAPAKPWEGAEGLSGPCRARRRSTPSRTRRW
jgi:hypothetical protein